MPCPAWWRCGPAARRNRGASGNHHRPGDDARDPGQLLGPDLSLFESADEIVDRGAHPSGQIAALEGDANLAAERAQIGTSPLAEEERRQVEADEDRIAGGPGTVESVPGFAEEDLGLVLVPAQRGEQPLDAD